MCIIFPENMKNFRTENQLNGNWRNRADVKFKDRDRCSTDKAAVSLIVAG